MARIEPRIRIRILKRDSSSTAADAKGPPQHALEPRLARGPCARSVGKGEPKKINSTNSFLVYLFSQFRLFYTTPPPSLLGSHRSPLRSLLRSAPPPPPVLHLPHLHPRLLLQREKLLPRRHRRQRTRQNLLLQIRRRPLSPNPRRRPLHLPRIPRWSVEEQAEYGSYLGRCSCGFEHAVDFGEWEYARHACGVVDGGDGSGGEERRRDRGFELVE